jgi:tetratricopeptide (TPR) repeat protein
MKLIIIAILLIIGGVPNLAKPETRIVGIICVLAGIAMIILKASTSKTRSTKETSVGIETTSNNRKEASKEWMAKHDAYDAFMIRWKPIVEEHYRLLQESERLYADANKAGDIDGPLMQRVIELCQQDICLEEQFRQYEYEKIQADLNMGYTDITTMPKSFSGYPSFKRLAIIYEKQKRYDDAIAVCECAIQAGRLDDGTQGKMPARLTKLKAKLEKERLDNATQIDFGNPFE